MEFFGHQIGTDVAEAKPTVAPPQAFFKSSPSDSRSGVPPAEATPSQSKTAKDRAGVAGEFETPPLKVDDSACFTRRFGSPWQVHNLDCSGRGELFEDDPVGRGYAAVVLTVDYWRLVEHAVVIPTRRPPLQSLVSARRRWAQIICIIYACVCARAEPTKVFDVFPSFLFAASGKSAAANSRKSSAVASRRPAGNKALNRQPFDLAAVQSLAGTSKRQEPGSTKGAELKRFVGGVKFWAALENVTRVLLLLLLGAGVGGLLLPQGRAAVAQAKFGE